MLLHAAVMLLPSTSAVDVQQAMQYDTAMSVYSRQKLKSLQRRVRSTVHYIYHTTKTAKIKKKVILPYIIPNITLFFIFAVLVV